MRNNRHINSHWRLRMYHRDALGPKERQYVRWMWDELTKEELSMVTEDETVNLMFQEQINRSKAPGFLDEKFKEYLKLIDFFYILEKDFHPRGFMAVAGEQLISLWMTELYRGQGKASYLIANHREIFDKPLKVQCYRKNEVGLKFYQARGFKPIDENGIYTLLELV